MRLGMAGALLVSALILLACPHGRAANVPESYKPAITRRALLIGIDDYSGRRVRGRRAARSHEDRVLLNLRGATRDVGLMREMLIQRYGFDERGIVVLKNEQATREAILRAIEQHLVAPAAKDAVLLFYYAGHGSQVANAASDELDGMDESLVPADSIQGADDIRDKELAIAFNAIVDKGALLTVIVDSCHSGSLSRALPADGDVRAVAPGSRAVNDPSAPPAPEDRGALVLSASKDFARAFEITDDRGQQHGAFSWALLNAMRAAEPGESSEDTFLRAQAIMRAEPPYQDPVMSGNAAARLQPLFRFTQRQASRASAIALEDVRDGVALLQGGWINGLTPGTILQLRDRDLGKVRIRVTALLGVSRSEGIVLDTPRAVLPRGTLFEVKSWSASAGRPLRVWIPRTVVMSSAMTFAKALRERARNAGVEWVDDPTEKTPTAVLRWRETRWELIGKDRHAELLSADVKPDDILRRVEPGTCLFVWLPASSELVSGIGVGAGTEYDNVETQSDPKNADYVLTGALRGTSVAYAWIRPGVLQADETGTSLPARTDWQSLEPVDDASIVLQQTILRLYKIFAWCRLESPIEFRAPYALAIEPIGEHIDRSGTLTGFQHYELVLRALRRPGAAVQRRYYYIFGIDTYGTSVLLFPLRGSVENRFPIEQGELAAREIRVASMNVRPPYGVDTYVLLSTDESLPNPSVLAWAGVRTRGPRGETRLEDLLAQVGGATRAPAAIETPPVWSVDRLVYRSIPPAQ